MGAVVSSELGKLSSLAVFNRMTEKTRDFHRRCVERVRG